MKSVVDYNTCKYLARKGMFYIMHRFHLDIIELARFISESNEEFGFSSISVGIQKEDVETLKQLKSTNREPTYITIDIAHAHSDRTIHMIKEIRKIFPDCYLIVGNVASASAVCELQEYDINALKIFVAPGRACTTKVKTGFTRGTVSCLTECVEACTFDREIDIIADGGVREPGHIALAIALGANMVMVGSYMSGFDQNSGDIVEIDGHKKYIYYGSASFNNKRSKKHVEGKEIILDYRGNMDDHIYDIECSLRSAVSYAGVRSLCEVYNTPIFYME